jgi:hypothetical protein
MISEGFSCVLYGFFNNDTFHSFVDFYDEEIHFDRPELNGKYIKVMANRIDVSFN